MCNKACRLTARGNYKHHWLLLCPWLFPHNPVKGTPYLQNLRFDTMSFISCKISVWALPSWSCVVTQPARSSMDSCCPNISCKSSTMLCFMASSFETHGESESAPTSRCWISCATGFGQDIRIYEKHNSQLFVCLLWKFRKDQVQKSSPRY